MCTERAWMTAVPRSCSVGLWVVELHTVCHVKDVAEFGGTPPRQVAALGGRYNITKGTHPSWPSWSSPLLLMRLSLPLLEVCSSWSDRPSIALLYERVGGHVPHGRGVRCTMHLAAPHSTVAPTLALASVGLDMYPPGSPPGLCTQMHMTMTRAAWQPVPHHMAPHEHAGQHGFAEERPAGQICLLVNYLAMAAATQPHTRAHIPGCDAHAEQCGLCYHELCGL